MLLGLRVPLAQRALALVAGVSAAIAVVNLTPLLDLPGMDLLFAADGDANVSTWVSSAALLLIAVVAFGIAPARRPDEGRWWRVIGAGFVLLSIDETASLHEIAGQWTSENLFSLEALPEGFLWVILVAPPAAVAAIVMGVWLRRRLGAGSVSWRLVLAALTVWFLVPVIEAVTPSVGSPWWLVVTEELLEGIGEALMLAALLEWRALPTAPAAP